MRCSCTWLSLALVSLVSLGACTKDPPAKPDDPTPTAKAEVDAAKPDVAVAAKPLAPSPIVQFEVGHYRACGVRADGRVVCWGPGIGSGLDEDAGITAAPHLVGGLDDAVQIAGDDYNFCARRKGGEVACFGPDLKAKSSGLVDVVELSTSCARHADGHVTCFDGDGKPSVVAGITARSLGGGDGIPCVIVDKGDVLCWGSNGFHQLADGTVTERPLPTRLKTLHGVDEVQTSAFHNECARIGGAAWCWGGELGTVTTPKPLAGLAHVAHLAIGEYHSCALLEDGTVKCWGSNQSGQLGIPTDPDKDTSSDVPVLAAGIDHVVELRVGGGEPAGGAGSTCVRKSDDTTWCWGSISENDGKTGPTKVDWALPAP